MRLTGLVVAFPMVLLNSLPSTVFIDVANNLIIAMAGPKLNPLLAVGALGHAPRFYWSNNCPAGSRNLGFFRG